MSERERVWVSNLGVSKWVYELVNEWIGEGATGWVIELVSKWVNKWVSCERVSERAIKWVIELESKWVTEWSYTRKFVFAYLNVHSPITYYCVS